MVSSFPSRQQLFSAPRFQSLLQEVQSRSSAKIKVNLAEKGKVGLLAAVPANDAETLESFVSARAWKQQLFSLEFKSEHPCFEGADSFFHSKNGYITCASRRGGKESLFNPPPVIGSVRPFPVETSFPTMVNFTLISYQLLSPSSSSFASSSLNSSADPSYLRLWLETATASSSILSSSSLSSLVLSTIIEEVGTVLTREPLTRDFFRLGASANESMLHRLCGAYGSMPFEWTCSRNVG